MNFLFNALMWFLVLVAMAWFVASWCNYVKADEVALRRFFGRLGKKACKSGLIFVPLFPGIDLVRIPTRQISFHFEGKIEHRVWSSDHQLLLVDISGYVRFPYDEAESLILMVRSGVPTEEKSLQEWMEEEVVSGLRDIMARFTLEQAIGQSNLIAIRDAAKAFFLDETGLFAKSGICGNDSHNFTPGTGEVIVRVEQVNPTPEVQEAMQAPVVARYRADAAKETAKQEAAETAGALTLMINEQIETMRKHKPTMTDAECGEIRKECINILLRDRAAKAGGLKDVRIASADGTSFAQGSMSEIIGGIVATAAAAWWASKEGGGQGNRGEQGKDRSDAPRKPFSKMTEAEKQKWAEDYKKRHGKKD